MLATIGLWAAVRHWNMWFDAMIYISDNDKMVLQLLIRKMLMILSLAMTDEMGDLLGMQEAVPPQSVQAVAILVTIGPIVFLYPFIQKHFVKGIMLGSIKG